MMIRIVDDYNDTFGYLILKQNHILIPSEFSMLMKRIREIKKTNVDYTYDDLIKALEEFDFVDEYLDVNEFPTLYF